MIASDRPRGLRMTLPARPENVALARHALAGMAEQVGMDEAGVADLKTVVTEACMNVVVHAYDGEPGPLLVEAEPDDLGVTVIVRDEGSGIRPRAESERDSLRLGLALIAALSSDFSISGGLDRGTEIRARLPLQGGAVDGHRPGPALASAREQRTEIVVDRAELLGPVLGRIVAALAARRDLSVDRVSDAMLVTDAVAAAAPGRFGDGRVRLGFGESDGGIDLRLGPMADGAAAEIRAGLAVPEVGGSLETLADELAVEVDDDGETLVIRFAAAP